MALASSSLGLPRTCPRAFAAAKAALVRWEMTARSFSAKAAYRCNRNGSTSGPRSSGRTSRPLDVANKLSAYLDRRLAGYLAILLTYYAAR